MDSLTPNMRRLAFEKVATLSTQVPSNVSENQDFKKLSSACTRRDTQPNGFLDGVFGGFASASRVPMSFRELQILLALCKAAPSISDAAQAQRFVDQLISYLPETPTQLFSPSPFLYETSPSPWEALSYFITLALLAVGTNFPDLHDMVLASISTYLQNCLQISNAVPTTGYQEVANNGYGEEEEAAEVASIAVSVIGFLDAAASYAHFWSADERLAIVQRLQEIFSEKFLISVETASSTIRNSDGSYHGFRDWRKYTKRYAASGRPLGAMLLQRAFMRFVTACTTLLVIDPETLNQHSLLDHFVSSVNSSTTTEEEYDSSMIESLTDLITDEMRLLEDGSDYLQLGSAWQQRLAFSVKTSALIGFLCCMVLDEDIADSDVLLSWLEDTMTNQVQMADEELAEAVLKCMTIVAKLYPVNASNLGRSILRFIVQGGSTGAVVEIAAFCLAQVLQILSQDAIITTLYSLGNVLSSGTNTEKPHSAFPSENVLGGRNISSYSQERAGSMISLSISGEEETSLVYGNVAHAIVTIATSCKDGKILALSQAMLLQKIGRVSFAVDACIIEKAAALAAAGGQVELRVLLKLYTRLSYDAIRQSNSLIMDAITKALNFLSLRLPRTSPLYRIYLRHLLEGIVSKGDIRDSDDNHQAEVELAAREIGRLLKPLALLISSKSTPDTDNLTDDEDISTLFRDAWFNISVHGLTLQSDVGRLHYQELRQLAMYSEPLVAGDRADQLESDVELNTVLRRGMNTQHIAVQKKRLIQLLPSKEIDIRRLSYPKVIFLIATHLVETLRAESGDCAKVLTYVQDPSLKQSDMGNCMVSIAEKVIAVYLDRALSAQFEEFSASYIGRQLAQIFARCCHRIEKVQQIAAVTADKIITQTPSALCQKSSLFALLELLSIMWSSCLDADIEEYSWQSTFTSARGKVTVELSDDYILRRRTLNSFYRRAKEWVMAVMSIAPLDVKGLLQTYLSEYDDEGAYGHVSLGRSFALELGSVIPNGDQRLRALENHGECPINVGSDFIAQYTTRQEYRYAEALPDHDPEWLNFMPMNGSHTAGPTKPARIVEDAQTVLAQLESRTRQGKFVSIGELRDVLRRAAALLCRSKKPQCAIVHHLVGIPFAVFSKQSIKLGISLWLGVIHENPRMEPRIVAEVAQAWEKSVFRKAGIFAKSFDHSDPFFLKEEFAPSDKNTLLRRQQAAHNLIAPHFRILQFFESHFNAIRLGSKNTQKLFVRLARVTLSGLIDTRGHPLLREFHFHVILFCLKILRYTTTLDQASAWNLKDQILSAGLSWFEHPPRWSFGGNRLQIKAETQLLRDVEVALQSVSQIGSSPTPSRKSLQQRQGLLLLLLENELSRLSVWLFPVNHESRHSLASAPSNSPSEAAILPFARTAWAESPSLAIQLVSRFPFDRLRNDIRFFLLNFPERAIDDAEGIEVLLGPTLPHDLSFQLKYLLYWAPVDPISAVTYFLPAYGNHPFILQYAMRTLESHSVDITFFYVPQIVQALRYDALGYVERYIIETGKVSQLFAHQIIWNMKANAFKDEDSQIPDPVKPTLDKVMDSLISSFSGNDKDFYEREFSFFNEITDISGKLRPFIKKSKPEKKQKIEEELRKIKVEVGVYLPSNPEGVVIGIDRKSGKPLQSHAKAPYMATFRIKKTKGDLERKGDEIEATSQRGVEARAKEEIFYEVWQSAIFKVGDDCRQDVLALQMIAAFRGIFNQVGLDVYVFPYRVTATAPGCGVIDVLPNSISRDMLGREAVNGLYDYFVSKYGGEDSIKFQEARSNFVKSMAAYSLISYLLQFKDRHNGNIMVDDAGHILHIDFGFCFDIAPGGVRFERAPFKLTSEMVAVMGGSTDSQSYRWFEELCIKAFLASRLYTEKLVHIVVMMLDSGLPCFKPDTIKHFRERFVLEKSEREAAEFMKELVRKSYSSYSTKGYDQFQLLTNGIPY